VVHEKSQVIPTTGKALSMVGQEEPRNLFIFELKIAFWCILGGILRDLYTLKL